jgi:hypothetical protein
MEHVSIRHFGIISTAHGFIGRGPAVGDGVERGIMRAAIHLIAGQPEHWKTLNDHGHVTWAVRSNASSVRLARAKAHGTLCALHFAWLGTLPLPISPYMFLLAISGHLSEAFDLTFMTAINPELAEQLREWPLVHSEPLNLRAGSTTSQLILTYLHHVQVNDMNFS